MDIKLALLFLFVSAMITLSHLDDENVERIKQQLRRRTTEIAASIIYKA